MTTPTPAAGRRVLHVSQAVLGVAFVVEDYVRSQVKEGWHVSVACPDGMLAEMARDAGAEVLRWPAERRPHPRDVARELRSLAPLVRRAHPDLVHLHSAKAGLVGRLVVRGTLPTVYSPHAWSWLAATGAERTLARRWERFASRWTDVICSVSEAEKRLGEEAGIRGHYEVLTNDVDIVGLRASAPFDRREARDRLGMPREARVAVCPARLSAQKGQDVLLAAWPKVRDAVPGAALYLVGDGPDEERTRALAAALQDVVLVGHQPRELSLAWMVAADVVVLPSRYEGMPLVPLEAAALGRAVVCTDVQGVREGGFDASRTIVPVDDAPALGAALVGVLADDARRREAEAAARVRADALARQPRSTANVLRMYDQLLSG